MGSMGSMALPYYSMAAGLTGYPAAKGAAAAPAATAAAPAAAAAAPAATAATTAATAAVSAKAPVEAPTSSKSAGLPPAQQTLLNVSKPKSSMAVQNMRPPAGATPSSTAPLSKSGSQGYAPSRHPQSYQGYEGYEGYSGYSGYGYQSHPKAPAKSEPPKRPPVQPAFPQLQHQHPEVDRRQHETYRWKQNFGYDSYDGYGAPNQAKPGFCMVLLLFDFFSMFFVDPFGGF